MKRHEMIRQLRESSGPFDIFVIGGGSTGLGVAVDSASRGYKTALVEQSDFACAATSRSSKMIHGGIRYLKQGDIPLVREALRERGILRKIAPGLVSESPFIVPSYTWWEGPFYGLGMKCYDLLAGGHGFRRSEILSREEILAELPTLNPKNLRGGTRYFDGHFDDSSLAMALAATAASEGATLVNYVRAEGFQKKGDKIISVELRDLESNETFSVQARVFINATGPFGDFVSHLDDPSRAAGLRPSQGAHIVLDREFLPGRSALIVPKTSDGRVLYVVPWHGSVIVGPTETAIKEVNLTPRPEPQEIEFLLSTLAPYLKRAPKKGDVRSTFAGIRPLAAPSGGSNRTSSTAKISREHSITVSSSGLITISGGKWTTYRKMAEDALDLAANHGSLPAKNCRTSNLPLKDQRRANLESLLKTNPELSTPLHPVRSETKAEVVLSVREEMARTVEDVLGRRLRVLFLDARIAREMSSEVAALIAQELQRDSAWVEDEARKFSELCRDYLPGGEE